MTLIDVQVTLSKVNVKLLVFEKKSCHKVKVKLMAFISVLSTLHFMNNIS